MVHIIHSQSWTPQTHIYQSKSPPAQDLFIDMGNQCHEWRLGVRAAAELNASLASEGHGAVVKATQGQYMDQRGEWEPTCILCIYTR